MREEEGCCECCYGVLFSFVFVLLFCCFLLLISGVVIECAQVLTADCRDAQGGVVQHTSSPRARDVTRCQDLRSHRLCYQCLCGFAPQPHSSQRSES